MEESLVIENVSKSFLLKNGETLQVLSNVKMDLENIPERPQILSILGPSGVGKKTLLRILAGLDKPDSGAVILKGNKDRQVRSGDIGVVFQEMPLFDDLTVLKNLVEPAKYQGFNGNEAKEKALKLLGHFDLTEIIDLFPLQLSKSQREVVSITQQLMIERSFIIFQDPFTGIDANLLAEKLKLIKKISSLNTDKMFIIFTHDITSALLISDKICLLGNQKNNEQKSGSYIANQYDLFDEGLAFRNNIEDLPRFQTIRKEIKNIHFPGLIGNK